MTAEQIITNAMGHELVEQLKREWCGQGRPRPSIIDIPPHIVRAAVDIELWMRTHGHKRWELMGVCSRDHAEELRQLKNQTGEKP